MLPSGFTAPSIRTMSRFYIKVKPDTDTFRIDTSSTHPTVFLTEPAEQGRANAELQRRLTRLLGEEVSIVAGHHSSRKEIAVDMAEDEARERLAE
ncbi:MAG: DUF167 family protein [Candidatus Nanohaloarchaea archaeon]|nr:DUF167 family protein [Candidatus Nanohaloarchaea archaeon]